VCEKFVLVYFDTPIDFPAEPVDTFVTTGPFNWFHVLDFDIKQIVA